MENMFLKVGQKIHFTCVAESLATHTNISYLYQPIENWDKHSKRVTSRSSKELLMLKKLIQEASLESRLVSKFILNDF